MSTDEISNKWVIIGAILLIAVVGYLFFKPQGSDEFSGNRAAFHSPYMADAPCHKMGGEWMGKCSLREIELSVTTSGYSEPTLRVKQGELVRIKATSKDEPHSLVIPSIGFDMPITSQPSIAEFMAPAPGTYDIDCDEHDHKGKLIVV